MARERQLQNKEPMIEEMVPGYQPDEQELEHRELLRKLNKEELVQQQAMFAKSHRRLQEVNLALRQEIERLYAYIGRQAVNGFPLTEEQE